jgi:hypothetical protein
MHVRGFATSYMGSMYEVKWGREREEDEEDWHVVCVCVCPFGNAPAAGKSLPTQDNNGTIG